MIEALECRLTLREGRILWDQYGLSCPSWEEAGEYRMLENSSA